MRTRGFSIVGPSIPGNSPPIGMTDAIWSMSNFGRVAPPRLVSAGLHHRALTLAQGARRVLGRHRREQLEIIEWIFGFRRLLHLQQVIRPHHTPVFAHLALGVEI